MWMVFASIAVVGLLTAAEWRWPADHAPAQRGLNALAWVVGVLVSVGLQPAVGGVAVLAVNRLGGGLVDLSSWPWLVGFAAFVLAMDLGEYLFHRAQHAIPWLWRMHSLHHSDPNMNATTAVRHFWADPLIKGLTIWLAVGLLFKASPSIVLGYALLSFYNFFTHANLPVSFGRLSWAWNGPAYHRVHHSSDPAHYDTNFAALLPIWDVLSGRYRKPERGVKTGTERQPSSVIDVLLWPLRG